MKFHFLRNYRRAPGENRGYLVTGNKHTVSPKFLKEFPKLFKRLTRLCLSFFYLLPLCFPACLNRNEDYGKTENQWLISSQKYINNCKTYFL
jgi:hypothetical protein